MCHLLVGLGLTHYVVGLFFKLYISRLTNKRVEPNHFEAHGLILSYIAKCQQ